MKKQLIGILSLIIYLAAFARCQKLPEPVQNPEPESEPAQNLIPTAVPIITPPLGIPRSEVSASVSTTSYAYVALAESATDILLVYDGGNETREMVRADEVFETVPKGNLIASGLHGRPQSMAGEYIVTREWDYNELSETIYSYTLDGEFIAVLAPGEEKYYYASPLGDYVWVVAADRNLICDRALNILFEYPRENIDESGIYIGELTTGPNMLYSSDKATFLHRTYLLDGTRLVTWFDPNMANIGA